MIDDPCDCSLCRKSRRIRDCVATLPVGSEAAMLIETLSEELWAVGEELSLLQVVMDGSWPDAVERLEFALARAKQMRQETPDV